MQTKRVALCFGISVLVHTAILAAVFAPWGSRAEGELHIAGEPATYFSMEMLQGMRVEDAAPEPPPQHDTAQPQPEQETVATPEKLPDPKPEPIKEAEKKPDIAKAKPKEKPKTKPKEKPVKEKTAKQEKSDPSLKHLPIGDRNVNSTANLTVKAGGTGAATTIGAGQGKADEIGAYRTAIHREIERQRRYPTRAKMMRKQGIVMIKFAVSANGTLSDPTVIKSSGDDSLDQAALWAVKNARSAGPRPNGFPPTTTVPVQFTLNN